MTPPLTLTLGHLYPDQLNLYGDRGNILVLRQRCQQRGIQLRVVELGIAEAGVLKEHHGPPPREFGAGGHGHGVPLVDGADVFQSGRVDGAEVLRRRRQREARIVVALEAYVAVDRDCSALLLVRLRRQAPFEDAEMAAPADRR